MTPREQCEVYEVLGAADAAVAWCVKIGSDTGYYASLMDEATARALFGAIDCVTAGQVPPNGRAERVDGGYRVSGRWSFGSGTTHADVIIGGCHAQLQLAVLVDGLGETASRSPSQVEALP